MQRGLLLFAHGARDPRWALPFEAVAARVRELGGTSQPPPEVRLSFLEFMTPGLVEAGMDLAAAGCQQVDVVPLFLGAGGHVRKDLPVLLAQLQAAHPTVIWCLNPAVGESPQVVEAMALASMGAMGTPPSARSERSSAPAPERFAP
jgi:sirohydrochlorin cobaltochelatase